jgi:hypothetical protein
MAYNSTIKHFVTRLDGGVIWSASTAYAADDVVIYLDNSYRALTAHTSTSSFQTDLLAGRWMLLSPSVINYISNPRAVVDTTGWATYADAAGTAPVDGTGGSPTVTWTRSTSSPLRGAADFNFTKDAANRQGEGVATDITIDLADQAKVLTVSFDYEVLSGTYATGDLTVYLIADPAGTPVVIQPAGYQIQSGTAGTKLKQIATFQTQATGQTYRVCFHVASTSALAYSLAIDNVVVGPQTVQYGAPVTDWQAYTPTGSFTNTTYTAQWRRVGDSMEINMTATCNAAPSPANFTFNLPSGYTIDTTKLNGSEAIGTGFCADVGSTGYSLSPYYVSPTAVGAMAFYANGLFVYTATVTNILPVAFAATDFIVLKVRVPILGWSSTVQMSNDTDTRVVTATLGSGTATLSAAFSDVSFTVVSDTHGAFSGATYTVPVSGFYSLEVEGRFSSSVAITATNAIGFRFLIDGASAKDGSDAFLATSAQWSRLFHEVYLNAGQLIKVQAKNQNASPTFSVAPTFNIKRLSGPSAIAATETVAMRANKTTGTHTSSGAWQDVTSWSAASQDTHGIFNATTGVATIPVSGTYLVAGNIGFNGFSSGGMAMKIQKNSVDAGIGSTSPNMGPIGVASVSSMSILLKCAAGDTIKAQVFQNSGGTINYITTDAGSSFSIVRVGN